MASEDSASLLQEKLHTDSEKNPDSSILYQDSDLNHPQEDSNSEKIPDGSILSQDSDLNNPHEDSNIEQIPDGSILSQDSDQNHPQEDSNSEKIPDGSILFRDLDLNHLPEDIRNEEMLDYLTSCGDSVVRVVISNASGEKQFTSGYLVKYAGSYVINVSNDFIEGRDASLFEFEFRNNKDDDSDVVRCKGTEFVKKSRLMDRSLVKFDPVPDFVDKMSVIDLQYYFPRLEYKENGEVKSQEVLILPSKHNNNPVVMVPGAIDLNKMDDLDLKFCDNTVSKLASHWITFEPIPDELRKDPYSGDYSRCNVLIVDDFGGATVGASTEYVSGEFLLKLPRAMTKKDAEDCVIYFYEDNDSESYGTGIYFLPSESRSAKQNGLEFNLEKSNKKISEEFNSQWMLSFDPVPEQLSKHIEMRNRMRKIAGSDTGRVVVLGYPNGKEKKTVTFGERVGCELMTKADSRVDSTLIYTSKTCEGLKGSLVVDLQSGQHFTHEGIHESSSEGSESHCSSGINFLPAFVQQE